MHHFFVSPDQVSGELIILTGADVRHIRNVLRMKPGEQVMIRDGISNNYLCRLEQIEAQEITARILSVDKDQTELSTRLYLFQGLPKSDKMEWIIQKAVELGVYQIIPVATKRSVVKLDAGKAAAKVKRWNSIAEGAAKQSGRMIIPEVTQVMQLDAAFGYAADFDVNLIPYELAEGMKETREFLDKVQPGMQVGIFIGPEGGFEIEEIEMARNRQILPITLGRRILRTETAGLAALSILMFQLEE